MLRIACTTLAGLFLAASLAVAADAADRPPNIVFVLADDLGYAELGCYGQSKIRTPNIDRLASQGMRFTQHYSGNAVCAPSRCVLMTGRHPGHAFVRNNRSVGPEGQYPLPAGTTTLARLLQAQGYATGGFGKWGLGGPDTDGRPLEQGLDRFFGYNCQAVAHNYYPTYLWDDERRLSLDNPSFKAHQKLPPDADPNDPASYRRYAGRQYAPDLIQEQALQFVRDHRERPFFLYVPSIIPHLALQVPDDALAEYREQLADEPYVGDSGYLPHQTPHAAYAAMVTRLDEQVGQIAALLDELGLADDTVFIFTSDNGPTYRRTGGADSDFFDSSGPLRGRKGSLYEGGIRVPCIVRWPNRIEAGADSDRVTGFEDWLPTIMELAGQPVEDSDESVDGVSFAPTLLGETQTPREFLYREFPAYGGQQSVRVGDWKAVRQNLLPRNKRPPTIRTELYDLSADAGETTDVAADNPEVVARLEALLREQRTPSAEFPFPALDNEQAAAATK